MKKKIIHMLNKGVEDHIFTGAVAHIDLRGEICCEAAGIIDIQPCSTQVTPETVFDLASLTKPIATTLLVIYLEKKGLLRLNNPISHYLPLFKKTLFENVPLWRFLNHSSGMQAYSPYFKTLFSLPEPERKKRLELFLTQEKPCYTPGETNIYSDTGFMVLEWAVSQACSTTIDKLFEREISTPLGLETLCFKPLTSLKTSRKPDFAVTGKCPYTGIKLSGIVHDENCRAIGGVCGHAGLFGTARDVGALSRHLLNAFLKDDSTPAWLSGIKQYWTTSRDMGSWALGFDTPSQPGSTAGELAPRECFGHLGFTGTSFWVYPAWDLIIVLLTNRVAISDDKSRIRQFRQKFHTTVLEKLSNGNFY